MGGISIEAIKYSFTLSRSEYIRSMNLFFTVIDMFKISTSIFAISINFIFGSLMLFYNEHKGWILVCIAVIIFLLNFNGRYLNLIRSYNSDRNYREIFEIELDEKGIKSSTHNSSSYFEWSYFERVIEKDKYFFFVFEKKKGFVIKQMENKEQKERFIRILEDNRLNKT
ncbi:YcxB family protein [Cohnella terricola]|uniref:YcxB family protein n=1 Tax=Cohnella terricola TaxID=1289167 RepID=A0A559J809_9BACL|nr:YcxB family protein [Cohnella terricola]TVX95976.1 YcxB family protein [Cohnella terricola]